MNKKSNYKPVSGSATLAARLLASGQRLRANETATSRTFALGYAAKWAQAVQR